MDFHLSYEWLQEFVDTRLPTVEIAERLSLHAVSVERMRRMDEGLDPAVVVARVEKIEAHPNADKLKVVTVAVSDRSAGFYTLPSGPQSFDGAQRAGILLRSSELRKDTVKPAPTTRVVCGGSNLREGMLVAFAPIGARVRWHGEGDLVELKPAEIRGVRSEGMICAASEVGLGEYFAGGEREILDVSFLDRSAGFYTLPSGREGILLRSSELRKDAVKPSPTKIVGTSLSAVLGLDDVILDCEITTNRPDLMSVRGLAREVAAITGARMRVVGAGQRPRPRVGLAVPLGGRPRGAAATGLRVRVEDPKRCPLYTATLLTGVTVTPSPWWMQRRLLAGGLHPINNVVDVTNYVLLEMGQPLHAFDAERLRRDLSAEGGSASGGKSQISNSKIDIAIRNARAGETIAALDGETYTLTPDHLVIADGEKPVAIAGVIGGSESAVGLQTTSVVLEAATFDPATVRKVWRSLDIRTESAIQYEKGVQPESAIAARDRALALLAEVAGAQRIGKPVVAGRMTKSPKPIAFDFSEVQHTIGVAVPPAKAKKALTALGCVVRSSPSARGGARGGGMWRVAPPWWRRGDLEASHDITEEIARLHGYHNLPSVLPAGTLPIASVLSQRTKKHSNILENVRMFSVQTVFDWEDRCRDALVDIGATEVFPFSLTSREHVARCGFTTEQCVTLENPLSEDLELLRPSLLPTLLPIVAQNQGEVPSATVFEMGNVYIPRSAGFYTLPSGREGIKPSPTRKHDLGLPREELRLTLAAYGRLMTGDHVEKVKGMIEHLFATLGIRDATFRPSGQCTSPPAGLSDPNPSTLTPQPSCLWHPGRTMDVVIGDVLVGVIGEVHPLVVEQFGIEQRVAVADLDWAALLPHMHATRAPTPPPAHPATKRDLAIVVDRKTSYADVAAVLESTEPLLTQFELFDTYEDPTGTSVPLGKKSLAFHLTYRHDHRTLTADEADAAHTRIIITLTTRFDATVRE